MREFVAEISSLGRMTHRNLVELCGWCKRNQDLLLVYEFMPNGSLDALLFDRNNKTRTILGSNASTSSRVLHRVFSTCMKNGSNWLCIEMSNPAMYCSGTLGYMAPELSYSGKATASSDVFAFGVLLLEVTSGRRPIENHAPTDELNLIEWARDCEVRGHLLKVADACITKECDIQEIEVVLKLGLVCCQSIAEVRPSMRQVIQYLNGTEQLPVDLKLVYLNPNSTSFVDQNSFPWSYGSANAYQLKSIHSHASVSVGSLQAGR